MARRKSKSRTRARRVVPTNARLAPALVHAPSVRIVRRKANLPALSFLPARSSPIATEIEDRRRFSFHPHKVYTVRRAVASNQGMKPRHFGYSYQGLNFVNPNRALVCARRKSRREVIHAKGVAGSKVRKPRRNLLSKYSCR
jgi:hypothetical protein